MSFIDANNKVPHPWWHVFFTTVTRNYQRQENGVWVIWRETYDCSRCNTAFRIDLDPPETVTIK
ncbi:MAG: hypothetical protein EOP06_14760 [Proteobacteria bacterium]|nr:MAG: hypothetical protein EOP06_14760 [Pseudomonadota bacterium]